MREKPEITSENILLVKLLNHGTNGEIRFSGSSDDKPSVVTQYRKDRKYHKKIVNFVKRNKDEYIEVRTGTCKGGSYFYINKNLLYSSLQVRKSYYQHGSYDFYLSEGHIPLGTFKSPQEFCSKLNILEDLIAPIILKLEVEDSF